MSVSLEELAAYPDPVGGILLDAYHPSQLGGSGETFDWSLAVRAKALTDRPVLLAGGLTPENVTAALEAVRPYAVDGSSGTEAAPASRTRPGCAPSSAPSGSGTCGTSPPGPQ